MFRLQGQLQQQHCKSSYATRAAMLQEQLCYKSSYAALPSPVLVSLFLLRRCFFSCQEIKVGATHSQRPPRPHSQRPPRPHSQRPPRLQQFFLIINFVLKLPRVDLTVGTVSIRVGVGVTAEVAATIEVAALPLLPDESGAFRFPSHDES